MPKADNLQGALELLVMKILRRGVHHGFALASHIQQMSDEVLRVEAGSLDPALHRMTEACSSRRSGVCPKRAAGRASMS